MSVKTTQLILKQKHWCCLYDGNIIDYTADKGCGGRRNTCDYSCTGKHYVFTQKIKYIEETVEDDVSKLFEKLNEVVIILMAKKPERFESEVLKKEWYRKKKTSKQKYDSLQREYEKLKRMIDFVQYSYWQMIERNPSKTMNSYLNILVRGKTVKII